MYTLLVFLIPLINYVTASVAVSLIPTSTTAMSGVTYNQPPMTPQGFMWPQRL